MAVRGVVNGERNFKLRLGPLGPQGESISVRLRLFNLEAENWQNRVLKADDVKTHSPRPSPPVHSPICHGADINVLLCQHVAGGRVFTLFLHFPLSTPRQSFMFFQVFLTLRECTVAICLHAPSSPRETESDGRSD